MFTELAHRVGAFFTHSYSYGRDQDRDAFLASSTDLADLERRMRRYDDDSSYPFHVHSSVAPRDWTA